jgi:hypothetical protein
MPETNISSANKPEPNVDETVGETKSLKNTNMKHQQKETRAYLYSVRETIDDG